MLSINTMLHCIHPTVSIFCNNWIQNRHGLQKLLTAWIKWSWVYKSHLKSRPRLEWILYFFHRNCFLRKQHCILLRWLQHKLFWSNMPNGNVQSSWLLMKNNLVYFGHSGMYILIFNVAGMKFYQKLALPLRCSQNAHFPLLPFTWINTWP